MDDIARTLKVTVKDETYAAAPLDEGQLVALQLLRSVPEVKILGVLGALFKSSFGEDAYTDIVTRMALNQVDIHDLMGALTDLAKATGEVKEKTRTAKKTAKLPLPGTVSEGN
jgi:hypothetical protein